MNAHTSVSVDNIMFKCQYKKDRNWKISNESNAFVPKPLYPPPPFHLTVKC